MSAGAGEEGGRLAIPQVKGPAARAVATSLLGAVGCVFLLVTRAPDPWAGLLHGAAAIGLAVSGGTGLMAARRLFDPTPGLTLDAEGIVDHSSTVAVGRVRWDEIQEIRVTKSGARRFLTLIVTHPEKFLAIGGPIRRRVNEANYRASGSPVNVTARTLAIPFDDLVAKTSEFYRRYGRRG